MARARKQTVILIHEPTKKGTSQGRKPITSKMNKSKKRGFKKYRGQGRH